MPKHLTVIAKIQGLFTCTVCDYKANNVKALKLHMKYSHGGGKLGEDLRHSLPMCGVCGKTIGKNKICCLR